MYEKLRERHAVLVPDAPLDFPPAWLPWIDDMLAALGRIAAAADNGYQVTGIGVRFDSMDVRDNRKEITATSNFLNFCDASISYVDDLISGVLDRVRWPKP